MPYVSAQNPPDEQGGWIHTLVTILSPAQITPSPDEEVDLRDYNNAHASRDTLYQDTSGRTKAKKETNTRVDWNGSPYVHPLARRNTNPRSAQRHHSGAIWRHILSSAVYTDLKREEVQGGIAGEKLGTKGVIGRKTVAFGMMESKGSAITPLKMTDAGVHSDGARGGQGAGNRRIDSEGSECAVCLFEGVCDVHRRIDVDAGCTQGAKSRLGDKLTKYNTEDIQIWRRFVRVDCIGLSGVLFYELAVAAPTVQSRDHSSHIMSKVPSHTRHSSRRLKRPLLTLESVFGDLDDPKSPSMHVDDLLDAVKAKVCYFPAYACTSFIAGQAILAFYRNKPELRPLPCADGFSVILPSPSATDSKTSKQNAGHSKSASLAMEQGASTPSWKDGSETAPFLGDPCKGSISSTALNLDKEDPYRMLMVRSCSHPTVGRSGIEGVMAYGNTGGVSVDELEYVKEKDDAKRDSGYESISGVLGGSSVFEGGQTGAEGTGDLPLDTILPLTPSDMGTPRYRESEKMEVSPDTTQGLSSDRFKPKSKARGRLPKLASLANITNVNASATKIRSSFSKPFGIAVSMPAMSAIVPSISTVSNISMYDTFASFLDFMEPDEGDRKDIVDVEMGMNVAQRVH